MWLRYFLLLLIVIPFEFVAQSIDTLAIECYKKDFVEGNHDIVDFIHDLYEQYDIVILGERDHRDTVQYTFIKDIISDSRFIDNVGYVYTEVGCNTATLSANTLIKGKFRNEAEFKKSAIDHLRREEWWPLWEKWNRYKFLKDLSNINDSLSDDRKITIGLTDVDFPWDNIDTAEEYKHFYEKETANRDYSMYRNFSEMYKRQSLKNGKRKALLVTNAPHAVNDSVAQREGYLIKQEYGDKVVIVLLNWDEWWQKEITLMDDGKVDAAFYLAGNEPTAIVLEDGLIGEINVKGQPLKYLADVMVFDAPVDKFVCKCGLNGLITPDFEKEIIRRDNIVREAVYPDRNASSIEDLYDEYNRERCFSPYSDKVLSQFRFYLNW